MTNMAIILTESAILAEQGILKYTGEVVEVEIGEEVVEVPEVETINTYMGWKKLGYKVKKGEEHKAEFKIWVKSKKYTKKEKAEAEEEEKEQTEEEKEQKKRGFYKKMAYWFTADQVEPLK